MKRLALPLLLIALAPAAWGQDADEKPQDLLDIYHDAQQRDAAWAAAQAGHRAAQETLPQARSAFLPSIGASANTTYNDLDVQYKGPTSLPSGTRKYNSHGYAVTLTQPVFNGQSVSAYAEAKAQVRQANAQLESARQDLILRVAQAYFNVLLAQDNVQLAVAQKAAIAQQLEQAKRGFEVGTLTITDTHEAQARYDLAVSTELAARNELDVQRQTLARITGGPPSELLPLKSDLALTPPTPDDVNQWVDAAKKQNLQVETQRQALIIASEEVRRNRAAHLPRLDIVGSYGDNRAASSTFGVGTDTRSGVIGLQLQMSLFQGGLVQSRVRQAADLREQAQQNLLDAERQATLLANQSFLGVTSGLAQVQALEQALVSSQTSLNSSKLGLEVGVRTNIDVLNAQQQLYNAERDLFSARYNYLLNELRLKAAVATLSESDLAQINALLGGTPGETPKDTTAPAGAAVPGPAPKSAPSAPPTTPGSSTPSEGTKPTP